MPPIRELVEASMAGAMTPIPRPEIDMTRLAIPRPEVDPSAFARPGPHPLARFMRGSGPGRVATPGPTPGAPVTTATATPETPGAFLIDEQSRRRVAFRADFTATMADGQRWSVREPDTRLAPRTAPDGTRYLGNLFSLGGGRFEADAEYAALIDDYVASELRPIDEPGVVEHRLLAQLELLAALLRGNYRLDVEEARGLVALDLSAEATADQLAEREAMLAIACGLALERAGSAES